MQSLLQVEVDSEVVQDAIAHRSSGFGDGWLCSLQLLGGSAQDVEEVHAWLWVELLDAVERACFWVGLGRKGGFCGRI